MKKSSLIIDIQYFPNFNYYKNLNKASNIILERYDEHQKKHFSNRTVIAGANGKIILSVPLEKGRSQKTISKDVRISNAENWQLRHWRSIVSSYNNSPWFKYFSDNMADLFLKRFEYLMDWDLACLDWTLEILKLDVKYELSKGWIKQVPGSMDLRNKILPGNKQSTSDFRYPQVFENKLGFLPDLSILDLIFCEGPKSASALLKNQA